MLRSSKQLVSGQYVGMDLLQDVDWAAANGRRMRDAQQLLDDAESHTMMMILLIVLEPLRYVIQWLIDASRQLRSTRLVPALFDLCSPHGAPW